MKFDIKKCPFRAHRKQFKTDAFILFMFSRHFWMTIWYKKAILNKMMFILVSILREYYNKKKSVILQIMMLKVIALKNENQVTMSRKNLHLWSIIN